ncbi:hypothetical protein BJX70DRAFT_402753 [Aspergillus crustosus]
MTRTLLDKALLLTHPKSQDLLSSLPDRTDLTGIKVGIVVKGMNMPGIGLRIHKTAIHAISLFTSLSATAEDVSVPLSQRGHGNLDPGSKSGNSHSKMKPQKWDRAYVSTKNIFLNRHYAETAFPSILSKATGLSQDTRRIRRGPSEI